MPLLLCDVAAFVCCCVGAFVCCCCGMAAAVASRSLLLRRLFFHLWYHAAIGIMRMVPLTRFGMGRCSLDHFAIKHGAVDIGLARDVGRSVTVDAFVTCCHGRASLVLMRTLVLLWTLFGCGCSS